MELEYVLTFSLCNVRTIRWIVFQLQLSINFKSKINPNLKVATGVCFPGCLVKHFGLS